MLGLGGDGRDPLRVFLEFTRETGDIFRHGCREHQRATILGGSLKDELEIFAEAQIQHLIGLIEHRHAQRGEIERATAHVVADPARCADNDMRTAFQGAALSARIHTANSASNNSACRAVEPLQLALNLHRQLARGRNDQGARDICEGEGSALQQVLGHGKAEGDGFTGAGLGRNEKVRIGNLRIEHRLLHRSQALVAFGTDAVGEGRMHAVEIAHGGYHFRI